MIGLYIHTYIDSYSWYRLKTLHYKAAPYYINLLIKGTIKFQRANFYHPELCRDAVTGSETDLCIWYRLSRSRSSLRHSHNRSVEGKSRWIQNTSTGLRDGRGYHVEQEGVCSFCTCAFLTECVASLKEYTEGVLWIPRLSWAWRGLWSAACLTSFFLRSFMRRTSVK